MSIVKVIVESYTFETVPQGNFVAAFQVIGNKSGTLADQEGCRFGGAPGVLTSVSVTLRHPVELDQFDAQSFIIYCDGSGPDIRWRPQSISVYGVDATNTQHLLCDISPWPDNAPSIGKGPGTSASCTLGNYNHIPARPASPINPRVGA